MFSDTTVLENRVFTIIFLKKIFSELLNESLISICVIIYTVKGVIAGTRSKKILSNMIVNCLIDFSRKISMFDLYIIAHKTNMILFELVMN